MRTQLSESVSLDDLSLMNMRKTIAFLKILP